MMGIIASTSYLAVFTSGTLLGASMVVLFNRASRQRLQKLQTNQERIRIVPLEERFQFPDLTDEYRLVMAIRSDLRMQKGKVAAQCGHAAVAAYRKTLAMDVDLLQRWMQFGGTKITVKVDSEDELIALEGRAKDVGVLSSIVRDAGQTQVAPGSRTVIALGPARKSQLEPLTGHLKLY